MDESETPSHIAPSPQLGLLNLITSQPSFDSSVNDGQNSTNLEQSSDHVNQSETARETYNKSNPNDRSSSSHDIESSRADTTTPIDDESLKQSSRTNDIDEVHNEIQRKMSGIIEDLRSPPPTSPRSANVSRHSVGSHHSTRDEINYSSPVLAESSTKHESSAQDLPKSPARSRTGSIHGEVQSTKNLSDETTNKNVEKEKNTTTALDGSVEEETRHEPVNVLTRSEHFDSKTGATDEDPSSKTDLEISNVLDETTRFDPNSPKHSRSRAQSTTSKGSYHGIRDEASTFNERKDDETKASQIVSDQANEDEKVTSRRPSAAPSTSSQVRSTNAEQTVEHPVKTESDNLSIHSSTNAHEKIADTHPVSNEASPADKDRRMSATQNGSRSQSPAPSNHSRKLEDAQQDSQKNATEVVTHVSRSQSPTKSIKSDNLKGSVTSRPGSSESKDFPATEERSKLIKPEEPISVNTDNDNNITSYSSSVNEHTETEAKSRPATSDVRKSSFSHTSIPEKDQETSQSRRESQASHQESKIVSNAGSRSITPTGEKQEPPSGSRRSSNALKSEDHADHGDKTDDRSRHGSESSHHTTNQANSEADFVPKPDTNSPDGHEQAKAHSRQPSTASQNQTTSKRPSIASTNEKQVTNTNTSAEANNTSKRGSTVSEHSMRLPPNDTEHIIPPSTRRSSAASGQVSTANEVISQQENDTATHLSPAEQNNTITRTPTSAAGSRTHSRAASIVEETEPEEWSQNKNDNVQEKVEQEEHILGHDEPSNSNIVANAKKISSQRSSNASQHILTDDQKQNLVHQNQQSRTNSFSETEKQTSKRPSAAEISPVAQNDIENHADASRRNSVKPDSKPSSKRPSAAEISPVAQSDIETHADASRRSSVKQDSKPSSKRPSAAEISPVAQNDIETHTDASRRSSVKQDSKPSSKRPSAAEISPIHSNETETHVDTSRRSSMKPGSKPSSKRTSVADVSPSGKHDGDTVEQKSSSRKSSLKHDSKPTSKSPSVSEVLPTDRKASSTENGKDRSRHSTVKQESRRSSKNEQNAPLLLASSRLSTDYDDGKLTSQLSTPGRGYVVDNTRRSTSSDYNRNSSDDVFYAEGTTDPTNEYVKPSKSKQGSSSSHRDHQKKSEIEGKPHLLETLMGNQTTTSSDEHEVKPLSRHGSKSKAASSRRTSDNTDNHSRSPARVWSNHDDNTIQSNHGDSRVSNRHSREQSQDMTHIHETQFVNESKDNSRRSSFKLLHSKAPERSQQKRSPPEEHTTASDTDISTRTPVAIIHNEQVNGNRKSTGSSKSQDRGKRSSSSKRNSSKSNGEKINANAEETIVVPLRIDSAKGNDKKSRHYSGVGSDNEMSAPQKLPVIIGASPQQNRRGQKSETTKRSETQHSVFSNATTGSEDDEKEKHWMTKIAVPGIQWDGDDDETAREESTRPKSPDANQIAERNQQISPYKGTVGSKKSNLIDGHKQRENHVESEKNQHRLQRTASADSANHIRLVDDASLDSASENEETVVRGQRRVDQSKNRDIGINTDRTYGPRDEYYQVQSMASSRRSEAYEGEDIPHKPFRATKPISEHVYSTKRRFVAKDRFSTTPETVRDDDTTTARSTAKHSKHGGHEKDPVNVNITVVVKKFSGRNSGKSGHTTSEAYIEEKPSVVTSVVPQPEQEPSHLTVEAKPDSISQAEEAKTEPYFDHVTPLEPIFDDANGLSSESKNEEILERPKSVEREPLGASNETNYDDQRYTQSDTEQVVSKQKKPKRPKRISRKCQTNENIFRRIEREQQQELRATGENEKNVQTRKSQLRPRKKSPRRTIPVFLSNDSFRAEDLLPNQLYQSRRNISKSSAVLRTLSPPSGKLLILRPTLPFHHTDAVNVQRVCLQYAIDLIPNDHANSGSLSTRRVKTTALKGNDRFESLPMIRASSPVTNSTSAKSVTKDKSTAHKHEDQSNHRKNTGAH